MMLLELVDKLVQSEEINYKETLTEIRNECNGTLPSLVLKQTLHDPEIELKLHALEQECRELNEIINNSLSIPHVHADDNGENYYTIDQFTSALQIKMGRTYGWRVDYVKASMAPGARPVTDDDVQKWQRAKKVPQWAYEQIEMLEFINTRPKHDRVTWVSGELDFLVELYQANPKEMNVILAGKCSERFNRPITESAIKGALDRLRKAGRAAKLRPKS